MSKITKKQKKERLSRDKDIAVMYMNKVGYISADIAKDLGIINYKGVIKLLSESVLLEWLKVEKDDGNDVVLIYYADNVSCESCGNFTVHAFGEGDCSNCHSYQSTCGTSTRYNAMSHVVRIVGSNVEYEYGSILEQDVINID